MNFFKAISLFLFSHILISQGIYSQDSNLMQFIFEAKGSFIPDFLEIDKTILFPIELKGLPSKIDSIFGLEKVCINVTHERVSDLKIELLSPDGTSIWLTNRNGRDSGRDYTETCFSMIGFKGYVYEGKAPFTGNYIPDGRIGFLNNGQNPNGLWNLMVHDLRTGVSGKLENFRLIYNENPPKNQIRPCHPKNGGACGCAEGKQNCELLPDLMVSYKMTDIQKQEYAWNDKAYPSMVRLAVGTGNIG